MRCWMACVMSVGLLTVGCGDDAPRAKSKDGGTNATHDAGGADANDNSGGDAATDAGETPEVDAHVNADAGIDGGQEPELEPEGIAPTLVDATGATLSSGTVTLKIPADALGEGTTIAVTPLDAAERAKLPVPAIETVFDGQGALTPATYAFTPHGAWFYEPVTVELHYSGDADAVLRLDDENDTTWESVSNVTFADGVASFEVTGFSIYAVIKKPPCDPCGKAAAGRVCGQYYSETCGRHIDLVQECGRPGCDTATQGCDHENKCFACVVDFKCSDHDAACGIAYDNCNYPHDLTVECPELGPCKDGKQCITVYDKWAAGGQYDACLIPCTSNDQCPGEEEWCEGGEAYASWWWCEENRYCTGVACSGCVDDSICAQ
jgi:hypothetical protein